jgi:hypothetical protein
MQNVKHTIRFAASMTLLVCVSFDFGPCVSAQQASAARIVGRWRSLETSKGGIGAILEFRSDGTVDFSPGAVVEMPWRIESNQLILPPETDGGAERKANLKWLGDSKVSLVSEAAVIELERVGDRANAGNPILGEWIERREMAGSKLEAHWLFYLGGKLLFLMPFVTQHGSYTISGSALRLKVQGLPPQFSFKLTNDRLTLSESEGNGPHRYARY